MVVVAEHDVLRGEPLVSGRDAAHEARTCLHLLDVGINVELDPVLLAHPAHSRRRGPTLAETTSRRHRTDCRAAISRRPDLANGVRETTTAPVGRFGRGCLAVVGRPSRLPERVRQGPVSPLGSVRSARAGVPHDADGPGRALRSSRGPRGRPQPGLCRPVDRRSDRQHRRERLRGISPTSTSR